MALTLFFFNIFFHRVFPTTVLALGSLAIVKQPIMSLLLGYSLGKNFQRKFPKGLTCDDLQVASCTSTAATGAGVAYHPPGMLSPQRIELPGYLNTPARRPDGEPLSPEVWLHHWNFQWLVKSRMNSPILTWPMANLLNFWGLHI